MCNAVPGNCTKMSFGTKFGIKTSEEDNDLSAVVEIYCINSKKESNKENVVNFTEVRSLYYPLLGKNIMKLAFF